MDVHRPIGGAGQATVNSDDPAYFGGYIDANYAAARTAMNLNGEQLVTLARNSFDACFATQQERDRWNAELASAAPPQPAGSGG